MYDNSKMISERQLYLHSLEDRDQRTIGKYLKNNSEPESRWQPLQLAKLPDRSWEYVVTIPACGEDKYLPGALDSIRSCHAVAEGVSVLCIVVFNGNAARESEFANANSNMRDWFSACCIAVVDGLNPANTCPQSLLKWNEIDILLVDRSNDPWLIPADQGVGLVRKIGADIALYLITVGKITCPWIHATDADARVPGDYFLQAHETSPSFENSRKPGSCCIYPYQHIPDSEMARQEHDQYWPATVKYELWMRYYVSGLKSAGSTYAYSSVGSLLAFNALAYAKIRGFPKRLAGEDFYFQNKLAKVGAMITLRGNPILLLTRPSTRVPFGTGQGTIKIKEINEAGDVFEVYHPDVFGFLKSFLSAADTWLQNSELERSERDKKLYVYLEKSLSASTTNVLSNSSWLQSYLSETQVFKNLEAAEQRSKSKTGSLEQFNDWFDGFRTLKLIHRLRDDLYGNVPLLDALQFAEFLKKPALNTGVSPNKAWLDNFRT